MYNNILTESIYLVNMEKMGKKNLPTPEGAGG